MFLLLLLLSTIKIHITRTLKYFKFKLYPITLKAVFRECRALDLKNVIDLAFKYPRDSMFLISHGRLFHNVAPL